MKKFFVEAKHFDINGTRYERFEDIPEKYRKLLDQNNNQIIDVFEEKMDRQNIENLSISHSVQSTSLKETEKFSPAKRIVLLLLLILVGFLCYRLL